MTKLAWHALLSQCGWLSVHQLAVHHSVALVHKILSSGHPKYLHNLFSLDYKVKTRHADLNLIKPSQSQATEHELVTDSFRWRAMKNRNQLPLEIRNTSSASKFNKLAKKWILENVPVG